VNGLGATLPQAKALMDFNRQRRDLCRLFFFDAKHILRTVLGANSAGNTLAGDFAVFGKNHYMEGTFIHAFAALLTLFLIDSVNTRFVLRDGTRFADLGTLAALGASNNLEFAVFGCYMQTGQILFDRVAFFVECLSTDNFAGKTVHTGI
jgi:hypothetical protein